MDKKIDQLNTKIYYLIKENDSLKKQLEETMLCIKNLRNKMSKLKLENKYLKTKSQAQKDLKEIQLAIENYLYINKK